jgi:outer membrane protein, heavy metal efflux system
MAVFCAASGGIETYPRSEFLTVTSMARVWLRALMAALTAPAAIGCVAQPVRPIVLSAPAPPTESTAFASDAVPVAATNSSPILPNSRTSASNPRPAANVTTNSSSILRTSGVEPAPPVADADQSLNLDKLVELTLAHNPILLRDLAKVESARGQALQAGLYPNPRLDSGNPQVIAGRNSLLSVGVMQDVVTKGKLGLDTAAANEAVRQAELTFKQNRVELLSNVRKQYFAVLTARRRVEVFTELSGIVKSAAETGKKLEKAQESSKIDTLLLTVDAQQVEANRHRAELTYSSERKQLAAVVGLASVEQAEIVGDLSGPKPDFDEELVRRFAANGSTLVQVAQAEISRRRLLLRRAEVEPYPNVTVGAAYQFGVQPGNDQFWLTMTFPIPVWDRNQGNIKSAIADVRDAEMSLRTLQNDQLGKVADILGKYIAARRQVESYERDILPNVRQAQKLSQEGYAKGVFDFARYLQAQRTVVETNLSYLDAIESLWAAASDVAALLQIERLP